MAAALRLWISTTHPVLCSQIETMKEQVNTCGRVHMGFYQALFYEPFDNPDASSIFKQIIDEVNKEEHRDKAVFVTGHSLGRVRIGSIARAPIICPHTYHRISRFRALVAAGGALTSMFAHTLAVTALNMDYPNSDPANREKLVELQNSSRNVYKRILEKGGGWAQSCDGYLCSLLFRGEDWVFRHLLLIPSPRWLTRVSHPPLPLFPIFLVV
jgi:Lipase (class 3)